LAVERNKQVLEIGTCDDGNRFASNSWHLPKVVLIEMASVLGYIFMAISGNKDSQR
jgi:hypothetical protein